MGPYLFIFVALVVLGVTAGLVIVSRRRDHSVEDLDARAGLTAPRDPKDHATVVPPEAPAPATATTATTTTAQGEPAPPVAPAPAAPSGGLGAKIRALFSGATDGAAPTPDTWAALEDLLLKADVGPKGASDLVERVRRAIEGGTDPEEALIEEITATFRGDPGLAQASDGLTIVMVVGVNGAGKTTSIGKLARFLAENDKSVSMAACDTFRAAAGEQLETWAERSGSHLTSSERGADPASVAFDGVKAAMANGSDILLIDTAGRLHTKTPLMDELTKVRRVIEKAAGKEPDEVLLVLDGTTGQNGVAQAQAFSDAVGVTGVILTKMDGSAKGGVVIAVREGLEVPVKFVGLGEQLGDLRPFDPAAFAEGLVRG